MRLENDAERNYYLAEASSQNWSVRQLQRNIKSAYYQRVWAHQKPAQNLAVKPAPAFIKDPYVLEFLNVPEDLSGNDRTANQTRA